MFLETVEKLTFAQINDKRYYFEGGIISLPFSYSYLSEIIDYKQKKKQKVKSWIYLKKKECLQNGKRVLVEKP